MSGAVSATDWHQSLWLLISRRNATDTKARPFSCPTCNKQFTRQDSLSRHVRLHTGGPSGPLARPTRTRNQRSDQRSDLMEQAAYSTTDSPRQLRASKSLSPNTVSDREDGSELEVSNPTVYDQEDLAGDAMILELVTTRVRWSSCN
jgi:uncharacterized C2H2 Zn-finger protein